MVARMRDFAVALPIALVLGAFAAEAQVNPFRPSDVTLPQTDREKMKEAAGPLYLAESPKVGETASWADSETGDFGTVELTEVFDWQGMSCRKLRHIVKIKGVRDTISLTVDRCKTKSGEWKIRY